MGDDRPLRYADADGTIVYRASGLGTCDGVVLGLARGRMPAQKPEWFQRVLDEGTENEDAILSLYSETYGVEVGGSQDEFVLEVGEFYGRRVIVRGHTDGLLTTSDPVIVQEAKKFRDSTWPKFLSSGVECMSHYPFQTSVYFHAADAMFPEREIELHFIGGHLEFEDDEAKTGGRITEVVMNRHTTAPVPLIAIKKRIARWERMIEEGMDLSDMREPCVNPQFPCPMFNKGCPSQDHEPEVTDLTGDLLVAADAIGERLVEVRGLLKDMNAQVKVHKDKVRELEEGLRAIHTELGDSPKKMQTPTYTFSHVTSVVEPRMQKGYSMDYFKVTPKKESNK